MSELEIDIENADEKQLKLKKTQKQLERLLLEKDKQIFNQ